MSKVFSKLEKKIINSLLFLDKREGLNLLGNMIAEYLTDDYYIEINSESDAKVMLLSTRENQVDFNFLDSKLFELVLTLFSLFEYLKAERYIYFSGKYEAKSLGIVFANEKYIPCELIDDDLKKPLYEYATHKFFITDTFKQFVADDFKTKSEIKRGEELGYTRAALGVAFIGLLASIFIPLFSTTAVDLKNDVIQISTQKVTNQYIDSKTLQNKLLIQELSENVESLINSLEQRNNAINESNINELESIRNALSNLKAEFKEVSTSIMVQTENAT